MNLIIFDLDGTLVRLPIDYEALRLRLYESFNDPLVFDSIYKFLISLDRKRRQEAFRIMDEFELGSVNKMYVDPTIHEGFKLIRSYTKALVTLQGLKPAMLVLEKIGIKEEFSIVVTREFSLNRVEQIKYVMDKLGAEDERTIFIGDTENDLMAAKTLGILPIIVGSKVNGAPVNSILSAIRIAIARLEKTVV